ncbi:hypothetical protein O9X98_07365 [Agrobacterium salinitolerans]|nr:hypothetical protein [Agrobacterium salinitolerans]
MTQVSLTLNVFDAAGNITGEQRTVTLSLEAISDIVDHAVQLTIQNDIGGDTELTLGEMAEALEAYDLVGEEAAPAAGSSLPTP